MIRNKLELRQLRYFVRAVELGSLSRAAAELGTVPSTLSQQISRMENSVSTRLLARSARGVTPTAAGVEFYREVQLALRHVDHAATVAQGARAGGRVSIGLAPTTADMVGMSLLRRLRERYPLLHINLMECPTGQLSQMLNSRKLDLAILFDVEEGQRWDSKLLGSEKIYFIESLRSTPTFGDKNRISLEQLEGIPLILPSANNGLRRMLNASFSYLSMQPNTVIEIDALGVLRNAILEGIGPTLHAWSAIASVPNNIELYRMVEVEGVTRSNSLCCLSQEELSMAALGARLSLIECFRELDGPNFTHQDDTPSP
ncbi:LysR family transcriptional regulator [Candidimonas nitroreducens]|uniref:LysR family transcriptional regulator n=1 Tax=Candidimonas nitroreducens TaxID=683354 RepID=A0A225MB98_9BURK|nr:LysR family transcriptional regulator [Candidimonas nitroreducens]OWT57553.1 LysR family transcriptional regulator [Candidimonas nitroreducens]